jgi:alpha-L-fucosidase 2
MHSKLWYRKPASEWKEGLPIGNGMLAGMIVGTVERERLGLNHEWLWRAVHRHRDFEAKHERLDEIRRLFFEGKVLEAGTLANEALGGPGGVSGAKGRVDPYQPAGDLCFEFAHPDATEYRRQLDLDTGIALVEYRAGDNHLVREFVASAAHRVIAVRLACSPGRTFDTVASLTRIEDPECTLEPWARLDAFGFRGSFPEGVRFAVEARVVSAPGATVTPLADGARVRFEGCSEVILHLSVAVTLDGSDPAVQCATQLAAAPAPWAELLQTHIAEHQSWYRRVSLDLGPAPEDIPTDERLARMRAGEADDALLALYHNYGRYLLIASSCHAELPANLQGKWNEELAPPWDCDIHNDVNVQMNYWPAEVCGLPETTEPLFQYLERLVPHAREAARKLYNCDGIWLPIQTDPWGRSTPEAYGWDVWTGAAAWLAQHFWWRYEYGGDIAFLRERAYPFFKEAAAFYQTYLVRDPQGRLVPVPSQSPENYFVGGTQPVSLCVAATMDLELIDDLLTHAIESAETLGVDEDLREIWRGILRDLPPLQTGRYGQLQEWLEDYEEAEPGHRHISHLFALYPGDRISLEETPDIAKAARTSLERRLAHEGGHTGWSRAWTVCCWARLREGDAALHHLRALVCDFATDTLLDLHPPRIFQIDGNLGGAAGIAEMLLQSHNRTIRILPALPSAWAKGEVTGLKARGGFTVDIQWAEGKVQEVRVSAERDGLCRLQLPHPASFAFMAPGDERVREESGTLCWDAVAGAKYVLKLRM